MKRLSSARHVIVSRTRIVGTVMMEVTEVAVVS